MTKLLLDSGNPDEYKRLKDNLWGSTTNPSLIAKKLAASGQKLTRQVAFELQKKLVLEIVDIVPGAVSAEVFADQNTSAEDMTTQGEEIASWHNRVVVKLPTNLEGMKARTNLRQKGVTINNTLVFSQEQVFAISLHEKIMRRDFGQSKSDWPSFISPFVGRLDDKGEDGLAFLQNAVRLVRAHFEKDTVWMLAASIRNLTHIKAAIAMNCELMTVPLKVLQDWFALSEKDQDKVSSENSKALTDIPVWTPSQELLAITTTDQLLDALQTNLLDISHPLTTAGIDTFAADWQAVLQD